MSSGLMILLHKYLKLVRAFVSPADVIYCNRKHFSSLSKEDIDGYIVDLINNYLDHSVPYGTLIKLNEEASNSHSIILSFSEAFIICHELGHYLNGDLSNKDGYIPLGSGGIGSVYEENKDHDKEYNADVTGYNIYIKYLDTIGCKASPIEYLKPILTTFNLIYALGGRKSETHPHPYDRAVNIARKCYGDEIADSLNEALCKPNLLPNLFMKGR